MKANPEIIKLWSTRNKCFMCKHKFDKPLLLPVKNPQRGKFQPNFNMKYLFHLSDTHGLPADIVKDWVIGAVYGMELNEGGIKNGLK